MIGFLALLLINAALFVASALLAPKPRFPDATPEDPKGPRSEEGGIIPVVFGTVKIAANVVSFTNTRAVEQTEKVKTGIFSSHTVTTGFIYEAIMQVLLCHGVIDELIDIVWQESKALSVDSVETTYEITTFPYKKTPVTTTLELTAPHLPIATNDSPDGIQVSIGAPDLFGGPQRGGGIRGWLQFYWGRMDQNNDSTLNHEHVDGGVGFAAKYEGICHAVLGLHTDTTTERFNFGEFGNIPGLNFIVRRCPSALGLGAGANINGAANIAEAAYDVLTNTIWGLGLPTSQIDIPSFAAAGATLAAEGLGINISLTSGQSGAEILAELMRYADGQVQQHPITGKIEFTLNRKDYDEGTLTLIDESNSTDMSITRPSWEQLVNQVSVLYTVSQEGVFAQTTTQPIQDIAAQRMLGYVNAQTLEFPGVMDPIVALQLGARGLRVMSTPLARAKFTCNRDAADFRVGRPFLISSLDDGIDNHVFRVAGVDYGTYVDGRIVVDAVEDVFGLEDPLYALPVDDSIVPPTFDRLTGLSIVPTVTQDDVNGYLVLDITGGGGKVTNVQFQEQTGINDPSDWHDNNSPDALETQVALDSAHQSVIRWRVLGVLSDGSIGEMASGEVAFGILDEPKITLQDFRWTDSSDQETRTFTMVAGSLVHRVFVYDREFAVPVVGDPWPTEGTVPSQILTPDPVTRIVTYTTNRPKSDSQRFVQFDPFLQNFAFGIVRRVLLDSLPPATSAQLHASVTNDTADISCDVSVGTADIPVLVEVYENGVLLASTSVSTTGTLDKTSTGMSALGGRLLPLREIKRWSVDLTTVAGVVLRGGSAAADRDPLPYAIVSPQDFQAAPILRIDYDDDTDSIKVTTATGSTKTWSGLTGSGTKTYTVGDVLDDTTSESAYANDEMRVGYKVEATGGGVTKTFWQGVLHGQPTSGASGIGPTLIVTPTPGSTNYTLVWSGSGTITLSIDGGAYSTPPSSPITVARGATVDKVYTFKSVLNDQTVTDAITIPSLEKDTVSPDLDVIPGTPTSTTQPYTVSATNPAGGSAPTITVTPYGCTMVIGGVTYSTAQTVASGTVVTANRPSTTTNTQAHISFRAAIAGGGAEEITASVIAQLNLGPTLTVTPTPGATATADYSIAWTGSGTITLSIDGAAFATPPSSPITVSRGAVLDKVYTFKAVLDGQEVTDSVTIPSLEHDTVTPDLTVTPGTPTSTTQPYTVTAVNPSGGTAPTITVTPVNTDMVIGGVTYSTAQTVASGTVVTANRPSSTTNTQAHIKFRADIGGGGGEEVDRTVLAQLNTGPTLDVRATPGSTPTGNYTITYSGTGTITYSADGASYTTPPGSPISVARHDTLDKTYSFKASADGQEIVDSVVVPSLKSDGLVPDLTVTPGTPTSTQQPYTVTATNPRTGGTAPTITVTPVNTDMVIGGVTYSTAQTVSSGTVVTANRPSSTTTTQAHIKFRATLSGGGSEEVNRTIPAQLNVGPTLQVRGTPGETSWSIDYTGTGTITYSVDGGSFTTPPGSPITVTLDNQPHSYTFKASLDGQDVVDTVNIPRAVAFSPSLSIAVSGDDPTNIVTISWTPSGMLSGTQYDVTWDFDNGLTIGSADNQTSPKNVSVPSLDSTTPFKVTVTAVYNGATVITKSKFGVAVPV